MKKFLIGTVVLTVLASVIQSAMDFLWPLPTAPSMSLTQMMQITANPDAILTDPEALANLQSSLLDPASWKRMVIATIIASVLMALPGIYHFIHTMIVLPARGLRWDQNKIFLHVTDRVDDTIDNNPLLLKRDDIYVTRFVYTGHNTGSQPMRQISGYIRSDKTKDIYPLQLDRQPTEQHHTIPAHSKFLLTADLPPLPSRAFAQQFGAFTLVFYYNGHMYREQFKWERIALLLKRQRRSLK